MHRCLRSLTHVLCAAVVAACGTTAPARDRAAPASPPAPPSTAPTTAISTTPVIPADTYARIDAAGVPVRAIPGAPPDRTAPEGPLPIGLLVFVVDGPVKVDGVDWYLVATTMTPGQEQAYPSGSAPAVADDGTPAIRPETMACPALPADVQAGADVQRQGELYVEVGCCGGREIGLTARIGQIEAECWEPWGVEPDWLDCDSPAAYLVPLEWDEEDPSIYPVFEPGVDTSIVPHPDAPTPLPIVEVRGMFDHPAARDCRNRLNFESEPEPIPELTVLRCRTQFVVTAMRAIGR
jgi:hypothetical protein